MTGEVMAATAATIAGVMAVTWVVAVVRRDATVVDPVWGLGLALVAWVALLVGDVLGRRPLLIAVMVTVWGVRLAVHLAWRQRGEPEDRRYAAMRERDAPHFWITGLGRVFAVQAVAMWLVALPVQLVASGAPAYLGWLAWLGVAVWTVGLVVEATADWQLARFRSDPDRAGGVLDRGLWRLTRHPNYVGDALVWWGVGLVALETGWRGAIGLLGPLGLTLVLLWISAPQLERSMAGRHGGYDDYARRTSGFVPLPPRD